MPEKDIQSCLERSQLETLLAEFTDVTFKACVLVQRNWRSVRAWRAARAKRAGLKFLEEQRANEDAARGPSAEALIQRNVFARLSDKELDFYRDVFERIDEDHSGRIDRAELQLAFKAPRRTAPCRTVLHLIAPTSHPSPPSRTATPAAPRAQEQRLTGRLGRGGQALGQEVNEDDLDALMAQHGGKTGEVDFTGTPLHRALAPRRGTCVQWRCARAAPRRAAEFR